MRTLSCKSLSIPVFCLLLAGCAGTELAFWNPYYRAEWQEDERHGPTFHEQLAELRSIRENPSGLSRQEQAGVVPLLSGIVQDSSNTVLRAEATRTLGAFPSASALAALRRAVTDEARDVRIAACRALGQRGGADALKLLTARVKSDSDIDVRIAAADELSRFPDQPSIQALAVALNDKDPALQHQAVQSLKEATGRDYGDSVPAWRDFVEGRTPNPPETPSIAERLLQFPSF